MQREKFTILVRGEDGNPQPKEVMAYSLGGGVFLHRMQVRDIAGAKQTNRYADWTITAACGFAIVSIYHMEYGLKRDQIIKAIKKTLLKLDWQKLPNPYTKEWASFDKKPYGGAKREFEKELIKLAG